MPDPDARVQVYDYAKPKRRFGRKRISSSATLRSLANCELEEDLGDGYVEALRKSVSESAR